LATARRRLAEEWRILRNIGSALGEAARGEAAPAPGGARPEP
jgi:hypothetical protein